MGDALGSVGALLSGAVVTFFGWRQIDAVCSIGIALVLLYGAWGLVREATHVLMEERPAGSTCRPFPTRSKGCPRSQGFTISTSGRSPRVVRRSPPTSSWPLGAMGAKSQWRSRNFCAGSSASSTLRFSRRPRGPTEVSSGSYVASRRSGPRPAQSFGPDPSRRLRCPTGDAWRRKSWYSARVMNPRTPLSALRTVRPRAVGSRVGARLGPASGQWTPS